MKKEKAYRDFTLCELTHLSLENIFYLDPVRPGRIISVNDTAMAEISKRIGYGKKIIDREAKAGDLVMLESSEKTTYQDFLKQYNGTPLEPFWGIVKAWQNFYHALAKYAENRGRKVASLESGLMGPGSRFSQYWTKGDLRRANTYKMYYLLSSVRDRLFRGRIQARKQKLVIVAYRHAVYLENKMKPKKAIYQNTLDREQKARILSENEEMARMHFALKKSERKTKNKQRKLKQRRRWQQKKFKW